MISCKGKGSENMKRVAALLVICVLLFTACNGEGEESSSNQSFPSSSSSSLLSSIESSSQNSSSSAASDSSPSSSASKSSEGTASASSQGISSKPASSSTPEPPKTVRVTIPEGSTFMDIAKKLESKGVCSKAAFYKAAQSYTVQSFTVPSSPNRCFKMEGYLFPDTYDFYVGEEPVSVLRKMLNNYAAKSGMPSDDTLILASIIEREARSDENMRLVSSVFHNRIKAGMKLDSDPTRDYVNEDITGNSLLSNTSKYAGLYNTYKCKFPAGPICSPGARAIAAAKNPANTEYYYFFFGKDNQNHYSKTHEEHVANKEKYGVQYR